MWFGVYFMLGGLGLNIGLIHYCVCTYRFDYFLSFGGLLRLTGWLGVFVWCFLLWLTWYMFGSE